MLEKTVEKIIKLIENFLNFLKVKLEETNKYFSRKYLEKKIFFYNTRKKNFSFFIKQDTLREEFEKAEQQKIEFILSLRDALKNFKYPNKWADFFILTLIKDQEKKLIKMYEWTCKEAKELLRLFFKTRVLAPFKNTTRRGWVARKTILDKILWVLEKFYKIARFITKITIFFVDANLIYLHYYILVYLTVNVLFIFVDYQRFEIYESFLHQVEYKSLTQKCLEFIFYYLIVPPCKFIWYYLDIILNGTEDYDEYERMIQIKITNEVMQTTDDKDLEYITYLRDNYYSKDYQMHELYDYKLPPFEFPKQKNRWFSF